MRRMPSRKKKVLEPGELNELSTVDRLHFHLLSPKEFPVGKRDLDYLENLRAAWAIANDNPVRFKQVKKTAVALLITERQARNVLDDANDLFAPIYESNEEITREFMIQYYMRLARKAEEGGYLDTAKAAADSVSKIKGFFDKELPFDPKELNLPDIYLTSDPKVLESAQIEDAIIDEEDG